MDKLKELKKYEDYQNLILKNIGFSLENVELDSGGNTTSKTVIFELENGDRVHIADCKNNDCAVMLMVLLNEVYTKLHLRNKGNPKYWHEF